MHDNIHIINRVKKDEYRPFIPLLDISNISRKFSSFKSDKFSTVSWKSYPNRNNIYGLLKLENGFTFSFKGIIEYRFDIINESE